MVSEGFGRETRCVYGSGCGGDDHGLTIIDLVGMLITMVMQDLMIFHHLVHGAAPI